MHLKDMGELLRIGDVRRSLGGVNSSESLYSEDSLVEVSRSVYRRDYFTASDLASIFNWKPSKARKVISHLVKVPYLAERLKRGYYCIRRDNPYYDEYDL